METDLSGIQPVGNIEAYSGYGGKVETSTTPTTTAPWWSELAGTRVAWDDLPDATNLTSWVQIATPTTAPLAPNTRLDCEKYEDNIYGQIPCLWLAAEVSVLDFADWNPSVEWYNCTLTNYTRYCTLLGSGYLSTNMGELSDSALFTDPPNNAAPNSTRECLSWYTTPAKGLSPYELLPIS